MDIIKERYVDKPERERLAAIKRKWAPSHPIKIDDINPDMLKTSRYSPSLWVLKGKLPSVWMGSQKGYTGDGFKNLGFKY